MNKDKKSIQSAGPNVRLKESRESQGLTQKEVADRLKVPDTRTVGRWERGESVPHPRYRRELCRIFDKSMEELGLLKPSTFPPRPEVVLPGGQKEEGPIWKVPPDLTACLGRNRESAIIADRLKQVNVRLLTILGSGGMGKTRLAGLIAHQMRGIFADGVCFISFAGVSDPSFVLPLIAQEVGIQENGGEKLLQLVQHVLGEKALLFILDNFERVLGGASVLEHLLAACPRLKIVVTSQVPLYLQGEYEFPLEPLAVPEGEDQEEVGELLQYAAVELFVQRAQAYVPLFELNEENASVVVEICRHLDGLPLAIELAAACTRLFSPAVLLDQIVHRRFEILTNERASVDQRQLTLYATMKWSYDLLSPEEQWLFRHLAVFNGGCTLEAIERFSRAYEGQPLNVLKCVKSFIDRGLLRRSPDVQAFPHFTMLETLRTFGRDCLRQFGELDAGQRWHAEYCLALLEQAGPHLKGAGQGEWVTRLEREKENLRAALTWLLGRRQTEQSLHFCDTFGKFCGLRGYWTEQKIWLDQVLELAQGAPPTKIHGSVLRRAGYLAYRFRNLTSARRYLEQSVAISEQLNDQQNLAGALSSLGWVLYRQKEFARVEHLLLASVQAARASDNRWSLTNVLESLGRFHLFQGHLDEAAELVGESVDLAREVADKENLARILRTQVTVKIAQGEGEQAEMCAWESYTLAQELGNNPLIALAEDGLADVAFFQEEYEQAAAFYERCLLFAQELDDLSAVADKKLKLSDVALKQGDLDVGSALVWESLNFFRARTDNPSTVQALCILGDIKFMQKDFRQAQSFYKQALSLTEGIGEKKYTGRVLLGYARVLADQGLLEQAVQVLAFANANTYLGPPGKATYLMLIENYEQTLARVRGLLEPQAFNLLWFSGAQMAYVDIVNIS